MGLNKKSETTEDIKNHTCFSCGLVHERVEAQGIWNCPNALCVGSGAAWFRKTLKSYKYNYRGEDTINENEWLDKGIVYNQENGIDRDNFFRTNDQVLDEKKEFNCKRYLRKPIAKMAYRKIRAAIEEFECMEIYFCAHWDGCITVDEFLFHEHELRD